MTAGQLSETKQTINDLRRERNAALEGRQQARQDVVRLLHRVQALEDQASAHREAANVWTKQVDDLTQDLIKAQTDTQLHAGLADQAVKEANAYRTTLGELMKKLGQSFSELERSRDTLEVVKGLAVKAWIAGGVVQPEALRAALAAHAQDTAPADSAGSDPTDVDPGASAEDSTYL